MQLKQKCCEKEKHTVKNYFTNYLVKSTLLTIFMSLQAYKLTRNKTVIKLRNENGYDMKKNRKNIIHSHSFIHPFIRNYCSL